MLSGLMLTAFLMGLGGVPHCAAMCGAACTMAFPRGVPLTSLAGRCVGYALLGAVAAASAGTVAQWGRQVTFIQPLWVLLQAMALILGVVLLWSGQMPAQLDALGQDLYRSLRRRWNASTWLARWPWLRPAVPFLAGMAWAALPCGLLYSAVMVATLAPDALGGSAVMLAFALPSAVGVWGAPAVLRRLSGRGRRTQAAWPVAAAGASSLVVPITWMKPAGLDAAASACSDPIEARPVEAGAMVWLDPRWVIRLSGLMLAALSAWALYHQVMAQWRAWCA